MDSKKQSELAKKYWEGKSSVEEEKALFNSELNGVTEKEKTHFQDLANFSKLSLDADFEATFLAQINAEQTAVKVRQLVPSMLWKIAAVLLLGFSLYYISNTNTIVEQAPIAAMEEEDTEKAFEITKQALLLVSAKLNKAAEVDLPLDKFETTRNKIERSN